MFAAPKQLLWYKTPTGQCGPGYEANLPSLLLGLNDDHLPSLRYHAHTPSYGYGSVVVVPSYHHCSNATSAVQDMQ